MTNFTTHKGIALVSALLFLAFLSAIGGALLTTATIDLAIADNHRTSVQLRFLAEAGIEAGRESLRSASEELEASLRTASGTDGLVATSRDVVTLLAGDDVPLLPADSALRTEGQTLGGLGSFHVFLRNDGIDGEDSTLDTNGVVVLLSLARIGPRKRVIEAEVTRRRFPALRAALTLDGPVAGFDVAGADLLHIDGRDRCGGTPVRSVGVVSASDVARVKGMIEAGTEPRYTGLGPFPDVASIEASLPGSLEHPGSLERVVSRFRRSATEVHSPAFGETARLGEVGSPDDPRIVVVDGDLELGPGQGYGVLVVSGVLTLQGDFGWSGLILATGPGVVRWRGDGEIDGGLFVAKTRDGRTPDRPLGDVLAAPGEIRMDLDAAGGSGILYDSCAIERAYAKLEYLPISIRQY